MKLFLEYVVRSWAITLWLNIFSSDWIAVNVLRSVAFGLPGLPVDTHVGRLVRRLGLSTQTDPVKVETEVCALVPAREWGALSLRLILHGRRVCLARRPRCEECLLADVCPSASLPTKGPPAPKKVRKAPKKVSGH